MWTWYKTNDVYPGCRQGLCYLVVKQGRSIPLLVAGRGGYGTSCLECRRSGMRDGGSSSGFVPTGADPRRKLRLSGRPILRVVAMRLCERVAGRQHLTQSPPLVLPSARPSRQLYRSASPINVDGMRGRRSYCACLQPDLDRPDRRHCGWGTPKTNALLGLLAVAAPYTISNIEAMRHGEEEKLFSYYQGSPMIHRVAPGNPPREYVLAHGDGHDPCSCYVLVKL